MRAYICDSVPIGSSPMISLGSCAFWFRATSWRDGTVWTGSFRYGLWGLLCSAMWAIPAECLGGGYYSPPVGMSAGSALGASIGAPVCALGVQRLSRIGCGVVGCAFLGCALILEFCAFGDRNGVIQRGLTVLLLLIVTRCLAESAWMPSGRFAALLTAGTVFLLCYLFFIMAYLRIGLRGMPDPDPLFGKVWFWIRVPWVALLPLLGFAAAPPFGVTGGDCRRR